MDTNTNSTLPSSLSIDNSIKKLFTNSIEKSSAALNTLTSSVINTYNSIYYGVGLYIGLIFIIILCFIIAYLLYYYITTSVFMNTIKLCEQTKIPILCTEKNKFNFS